MQKKEFMSNLHFKHFRNKIIGNDVVFKTPYGNKQMIYADWVASGRLYEDIEKQIVEVFGPYIGNTHTETSETGTLMTKSYLCAQKAIKQHVNAGPNDIIITSGFGMTSVINKLQRILGLKTCGLINHHNCLKELTENEKPIVFVSHMEHHSNQTSWHETCAEVVVLKPNKEVLFDLDELKKQLEKNKHRKFIIGSFTACSNVTGIETPYYEIAKLIHEYGGLCFIDFAASAPYVDINMHPEDPKCKLDAIFFSPHKFLGGPGTSGVMIFDKSIYKNYTPDQPGGGTVDWTNPWGEYKYVDSIELREDGGTPGFLQCIRTALCIDLKNKMNTELIRKREDELLEICFEKMPSIKGLHILAENVKKRVGIVSFYFENIHYNLVVKLLNDRFGIQVRGGCACAGTYGHFLLDVTHEQSREITELINKGDLSLKPGWIRLSLHPTMTNEELYFTIDALTQISENYKDWTKDYVYSKKTNEFSHISQTENYYENIVKDWLTLK